MDETTATEIAASTAVAMPAIQEGAMDSLQNLLNGNLSEATAGLVVKVIIPAGVALLMFVVAYFAASLIARWVSTILCRRVDQTLGKFAGKFTFYALMLVIGVSILQTANVDVTSFAAIIAAAGFAIGLAFQGTLSNFSSGILLLVFRPFKVGDIVNAAGVMGKVNEIDLFTTTLDTPDNRRLIVPNSSIAGTTIENVTFHKQRRVDVVIGVAYSASLDDTRRVLAACVEALGSRVIMGEDRGYQILLSNLGASSVDWTVRVWVASADFIAVKEELTVEIKRQLDAHGLEIPFPQMQLHIKDQAHISSDSAAMRSLPIPKMAVAESDEHKTTRIRPRARG